MVFEHISPRDILSFALVFGKNIDIFSVTAKNDECVYRKSRARPRQNIFIGVTSHEIHDVSNHRELDSWFYSLCSLTSKKTPITDHQWLPSEKGPVRRKPLPCHDVYMLFDIDRAIWLRSNGFAVMAGYTALHLIKTTELRQQFDWRGHHAHQIPWQVDLTWSPWVRTCKIQIICLPEDKSHENPAYFAGPLGPLFNMN